jgi:hypothetical protein
MVEQRAEPCREFVHLGLAVAELLSRRQITLGAGCFLANGLDFLGKRSLIRHRFFEIEPNQGSCKAVRSAYHLR